MDINALSRWFLRYKRDLPWRETSTPYKVWVSEVMLQQTQVSVVVDYYIKWMEAFPTVRALAEAPLEQVIKVWEGLGYYSRARRLHEGALQIVNQFNGQLPSTEEELIKIKGIGPYTVGAILSFAYQKKKAAVDGNVLRVIARHEAIEEEISKAKVVHHIRKFVEKLLPDKEPWVVMEALIELGALVCKKSPSCGICPIRLSCQGYKLKTPLVFPVKKAMQKVIKLYRQVCLIECGDYILLKQERNKKALMADLWEFPYVELQEPLSKPFFPNEFMSAFDKVNVLKIENICISHSFTKYQCSLYPTRWEAFCRPELDGYSWIKKDKLGELPFSSGHRKLLQLCFSL